MTALALVAAVLLLAGCAAGLLYVAYRCDHALNRLEAAEHQADDFTAWAEELSR